VVQRQPPIRHFDQNAQGVNSGTKTFLESHIPLSKNHLPKIISFAISPFRPQRAGLQVIQRDHYFPSAGSGQTGKIRAVTVMKRAVKIKN
jgi:hypothetical protein